MLLAINRVPYNSNAEGLVGKAQSTQGVVFGQGEAFAVAATIEHLARRFPIVGLAPVREVRAIGQVVDGLVDGRELGFDGSRLQLGEPLLPRRERTASRRRRWRRRQGGRSTASAADLRSFFEP